MNTKFFVIMTLLVGSGFQQAEAQYPVAPASSVAGPITGGVLLGGLGLVAGAVVGIQAFGFCVSNDCESNPEGVLATMLAGESLGMALGVHLGNRRGGSFPLDLLVAAATGAAGLLLADADRPWTLVVIPVAQLSTTIAIERMIGRSRRTSRVALSVIPLARDRVAFAARVVF